MPLHYSGQLQNLCHCLGRQDSTRIDSTSKTEDSNSDTHPGDGVKHSEASGELTFVEIRNEFLHHLHPQVTVAQMQEFKQDFVDVDFNKDICHNT